MLQCIKIHNNWKLVSVKLDKFYLGVLIYSFLSGMIVCYYFCNLLGLLVIYVFVDNVLR